MPVAETPSPNPWDVLFEACRRNQLTPRERNILRDCLNARRYVSNGLLLITPPRVPAARRLMAKGYLAQSPEQPKPFDPEGFGLVVVIEQQHLTKLVTDANAAVLGVYHDPSFPPRPCDREGCGKIYTGPTVYCSVECAQADA